MLNWLLRGKPFPHAKMRRSKAQSPNIAIVGAGLAGLSAASTLRSAGFSPTLFEADTEAGGRLLTRQTEWALIDHGAQYFTVRDPHFRTQVEKWEQAEHVKMWPFEPYSFEDGMLRPSPDREQRYVGIGGMQHLPKALAKAVTDSGESGPDSNVRYGSAVQKIKQRGSRFELVISGQTISPAFDVLILALPAPRILPLLDRESSSLTSTLESVQYEPAWSVALGFDNASVATGFAEIGGIFTKMPEISWISHNSAKPSRRHRDLLDTWLIQFNPQWSAANRDIGPRQLQVLANGLLTRVLQRSLGTPVAYDLLYWPQARLSTTGCPPASVLKEENKALYCCGDWTDGGRIEDAYMSGYRVARAVIAEWA